MQSGYCQADLKVLSRFLSSSHTIICTERSIVSERSYFKLELYVNKDLWD